MHKSLLNEIYRELKCLRHNILSSYTTIAMQNSGIFLDINALRSVENIKKAITKYKEQQEYLLLKIAPPSSTTGAAGKQLHGSAGELDTKIFEHLCLIASVRKNRYKLGSWVPAIVGSFVTKTVDVGNFESCGSLWRFVRLEDPSGGIRVALECNEIGEQPMFLTSNLELSENSGYAAEWAVSSYSGGASDSTDICVQIRSTDDSRVLCCNAEEGLNLLSDSEIQAADMKGEFMWNVAWELIPEDSPAGGGDLAFLDDETS